MLQSQLAEIGIKLEIEMMELNVYVDRWLAGDFDMAVAQNGGRPDPYPMYNRYFTKDGNLQKVSQLRRRRARQPAAAGPRRDRRGQAQGDLPEVRGAARRALAVDLAVDLQHLHGAAARPCQGFEPSPTGTLFALSKVTVQ